MTVYVDVLLAVNYIVNLLLLLLAARFLGIVLSKKRLCLSAFLGAVGALIIFWPACRGAALIIFKIALSLSMAGAAFGLYPIKRLLKGVLALFVSSFLFAGLILGVQFFWEGVIYQNGVIYFNISTLQLVCWVGFAYGLVLLGEHFFITQVTEKAIWYLIVESMGKQISFHALADTGNCLREPFSGAPVIICNDQLADKIFTKDSNTFRLIPCNTIAGGTVLESFRPDRVKIIRGKKEYITNDVYIAKSKTPINGAYEAVFNPKLIE